MSILVEHILNENYVSAKQVLEARLNEIKEQKLFEAKKMLQAEAFGGLTKDEIEMRKKAGYRKAADVLGDPWAQRKKGQFLGAKVKVKRKKKAVVSEAMDIQPDPEGRVRGGKTGASKGTLTRNIAAKAIRAVRKGSRAAGDVGAEIVGRVSTAKGVWQKYKQEKTKAKSDTEVNTNIAGEGPSHPKTDSTSTYVRPGRLQRNVNTLMGREPGHVDTRTPEEKLKAKGGRLGKILRSGLKGAESGLHSSGIS